MGLLLLLRATSPFVAPQPRPHVARGGSFFRMLTTTAATTSTAPAGEDDDKEEIMTAEATEAERRAWVASAAAALVAEDEEDAAAEAAAAESLIISGGGSEGEAAGEEAEEAEVPPPRPPSLTVEDKREAARAAAAAAKMARAARSSMKGDRTIDDILHERALRFYDPRFTEEREKCFLVGLELKSGRTDDDFSLQESLLELSELAGTAGLEVVGSTYQRMQERNPKTFIGTGKVAEVKRAMRELGCCTVVLDDELSPGQQRNLEVAFGGEAAGIKVIDRTALILDIFAQHARTREGQLQVELALHMYRLPRLTKLWTHLERQGGGSGGGNGGVGLRGPGERQLEVDRRLLRDRITSLQKQIEEVKKHRSIHRRRRRKMGLPVIALVGYTNAGKSTLLNFMSSSSVYAENMLFATLDPTTRKCRLPGLKVHPDVLFTDTVGFIQKLPTNLVAAFRATLEEVEDADLLVHVVDVSNPRLWRKQKKSVDATLAEMGMGAKPTVVVWNKMDSASAEETGYVSEERLRFEAARRTMTVACSARTGDGMGDFVATVETALQRALMTPVEALLPYQGDGSALLSLCHTQGAIEAEEYQENGVLVMANVPVELANRMKPYSVAAPAAASSGAAGAAQEEEIDWAALGRGRHKATNKQ
jgi:GTP-binding protein HflX